MPAKIEKRNERIFFARLVENCLRHQNPKRVPLLSATGSSVIPLTGMFTNIVFFRVLQQQFYSVSVILCELLVILLLIHDKLNIPNEVSYQYDRSEPLDWSMDKLHLLQYTVGRGDYCCHKNDV